uniref:Ribosomal protein S19 n=1 Tax=Prunus davidiana var. potaninii TaxID=1044924 RepID=A0A7S6XXU4_9ROSA|nr:ribosomal protein S19 [Prunus davidiana var. potaninii]
MIGILLLSIMERSICLFISYGRT